MVSPEKALLCDECPQPTRLVEEGSLTWGRRLPEVIPFLVTGAVPMAVLAPVLLLLRLAITGQMDAPDNLLLTLVIKAGLGAGFGAFVGLCAGLFGAEGGLLGGVIGGVLFALAFTGIREAPFDPAARLEIVLVSCLGGALLGAVGYWVFLQADKRVKPG